MKAVVFGAGKGIGRASLERWRSVVTRSSARTRRGRARAQRARSRATRRRQAMRRTRGLRPRRSRGFEAALSAADAQLCGFDTVVVTAALFGNAGATRGRHRVCSPAPHRELRQHVVFCETRASVCSREAAARCAWSARWPASAGASRSCCTARARPGSRVPRGTRPQVSCLGLRDGLHQARLREDVDDTGLKPPPFAGTPDAGRAGHPKRHRSRHAGALHATHVGARDVGSSACCRVS